MGFTIILSSPLSREYISTLKLQLRWCLSKIPFFEKNRQQQNLIYMLYLSYVFTFGKLFFKVLVKTIFDELYGYCLADYLKYHFCPCFTLVGKMARASAPPYPLPSAVSATLATSQASVLPLCLVRATIFAMFDAPTMTSLHPPSPAVGRPLSCFISGRSVRLRQCRSSAL